jgi:hypothetical protein
MPSIPNNETIRHLCHFYHGTEYYLFMPSNNRNPIVVTDVKDLTRLKQELKSWCGMEIDVFSPHDDNTLVTQAIRQGLALHRVAEHMNIGEV